MTAHRTTARAQRHAAATPAGAHAGDLASTPAATLFVEGLHIIRPRATDPE